MPSRVWRNKSSSFDENTVSVKPVLAAPVPFWIAVVVPVW